MVTYPCSTPRANPTAIVKAAHLPSQTYGLAEGMSFGGVRGSDLSTAEAIFDVVFSSRVKIKRYMKYQLGILCLTLVPPASPTVFPGCRVFG